MPPISHVYKTVEGCALRADVYPPATATEGPTPAVILLHGGALIWGSCGYMTRPEQVALYTGAGYACVALDYRLAPESPIADISDDVRDGLRWVRAGAGGTLRVDPRRVALIGHSAGAYLALLAGAVADPPPRALVSLYGYGDIAHPCYTTPSEIHRRRPPIPEAEARAAVGTRPLSAGDRSRSLFYGWCRQQGLWSRAAAGLPSDAPPEALYPWCPERRIHRHYPPTLLLHGDQDEDVPVALSRQMDHALAAAGIEHRLVILEGFGHVFDDQFTHPDVVQAFHLILEFLHDHLGE